MLVHCLSLTEVCQHALWVTLLLKITVRFSSYQPTNPVAPGQTISITHGARTENLSTRSSTKHSSNIHPLHMAGLSLLWPCLDHHNLSVSCQDSLDVLGAAHGLLNQQGRQRDAAQLRMPVGGIVHKLVL